MSRFPRLWARVLGAALAVSLLAPVGSVFAQDAARGGHAGPAVRSDGDPRSAWSDHHLDQRQPPRAHRYRRRWLVRLGQPRPGRHIHHHLRCARHLYLYCLPHKAIGMLGVVVIDDAGAAPAIGSGTILRPSPRRRWRPCRPLHPRRPRRGRAAPTTTPITDPTMMGRLHMYRRPGPAGRGCWPRP